ncbi:MAG TPA: MnhB domain-containing protein [Candidatus Hydrogenedentes bacterium]|nr:MnhB domain-containing protein [Candidatus Hydrogenedentota bacterium]HQH53555.1 MnhB domain-containing protein [Candidatus Hydrogenedentota bacterium]
MRTNEDNHKEGMSLIVKTITRLSVGLILLYGIYIVLHGHLSPGGGFAGGVIVALSFVHLVLAFGKRQAFRTLSESGTASLESLGGVLFLAIALAGFSGGYFFTNVLPNGEPYALLSAGTIPLSNIAICLKVAGGLFAIFIALVLLNPESEQGS